MSTHIHLNRFGLSALGLALAVLVPGAAGQSLPLAYYDVTYKARDITDAGTDGTVRFSVRGDDTDKLLAEWGDVLFGTGVVEGRPRIEAKPDGQLIRIPERIQVVKFYNNERGSANDGAQTTQTWSSASRSASRKRSPRASRIRRA